jgi:hypothetical protein
MCYTLLVEGTQMVFWKTTIKLEILVPIWGKRMSLLYSKLQIL